jgi:hypothetical protein
MSNTELIIKGLDELKADAGRNAKEIQLDRDLEIKDAPVRKIACCFRIAEEMIEDITYITSFLS